MGMSLAKRFAHVKEWNISPFSVAEGAYAMLEVGSSASPEQRKR